MKTLSISVILIELIMIDIIYTHIHHNNYLIEFVFINIE